MNCRDFEDRLEALLDGALADGERRLCTRHLEQCQSCRELAEPLTAAEAPPGDLLRAVLASTSGSACGQAESRLCGWLDNELTGADGELMEAHLDSCGDCRALAAAMTRLTMELPRLAVLRPDPGFVAAVLAATLPLNVRLRRWWATVWPRWVRRPRFASEAAFVATIALVLVFATPGSPLEAVPTKALVLARTDPGAKLEAPMAAIEKGFTSRVKEPLTARYARGEAEVRAWATAAAERSEQLAGEAIGWLGTTRELLASLLESADEKASANEDEAANPTQEKP